MQKLLHRLNGWTLLAVALAAVVYVLAPQQSTVALYKMHLVTFAAVAAYWFDRITFPYARPDQVPDDQKAMAGIRRAIIIVGFMLAVSLAL